MIGFLLASAAVGKAPAYDIAYVARYYHPYPDKRISRHEVYVLDLHGRNRLQISRCKGEPSEVHWVSNSVVAWTETRESDSESYRYDLTTGRRRKANTDHYPSPTWPNEFLSRSDSTQKPAAYDAGQEGVFQLEGHPSFPYPTQSETGDTVLVRAGKTYRWKINQSGVLHFYKAKGEGKVWIVSASVAASAGSHMWLYKADWKTGALATVSEDRIDHQLSEDEQVWCARTGKSTAPYGPKQRVWNCEIWAGLVGGRRWLVTPGLVHTTEYRLRPNLTAADF